MKRFLYFALVVILGISLFQYFFYSPSSVKIPVFFSGRTFCPLIKGEIQGKPLSLLIDSGGCKNLYLYKNVFKLVQRTSSEKKINIHDFRGNHYIWPVYLVADVNIGSIYFSDCEIIEQSQDFNENTQLWPSKTLKKKLSSHGSVGLDFFKNYCSLFDFPNSAIFLNKSIKDLEKDGFLKTADYIQVPFQIEDEIAVISIQSDLGKLRVVLDTGAPFCSLKTSKTEPNKIKKLSSEDYYYPNYKLLIGDCDFGDWNFAVTDMDGLENMDGVLGRDFFLEHAVCFDFANQIVYIKKPGNYLSSQWKRGKFYVTQFIVKTFYDLPKVEDL